MNSSQGTSQKRCLKGRRTSRNDSKSKKEFEHKSANSKKSNMWANLRKVSHQQAFWGCWTLTSQESSQIFLPGDYCLFGHQARIKSTGKNCQAYSWLFSSTGNNQARISCLFVRPRKNLGRKNRQEILAWFLHVEETSQKNACGFLIVG